MSIDKIARESQNRLKLTQLLSELGARYANQGLAILEMYQGSDVHAYYRLIRDPTEVIHIKGDIGMSTDETAVLWVRSMNHFKMVKLREGGIPIGGEDGAVTETYGGANSPYIRTEYNALYLQTLLTCLPQLRKFFLPPQART